MKSKSLLIVAGLLLWCFAGPAGGRVIADDGWSQVRSRHFVFVGRVDQALLRELAVKLELFREAVASPLFARERFDLERPITVVVFPTEAEYRPFKPLYRGEPADVAGYYQPGPDVDYITVWLGGQAGRDPSALVFHEYVHAIVRHVYPGLPLWLSEGLAEYYSTLEVAPGRKAITLGRPLPARARHLRAYPTLPLDLLFAVDHPSPYYNDHDKRGIFYAQSWALVHYLLHSHGGGRRSQFAAFLARVAEGAPAAESFRHAFGAEFRMIEGDLKRYVRLARYPELVKPLDRPLDAPAEMMSDAAGRAETLAHLGDLLRHTDRPDEAADYLQRALALDPQQSLAHTSLGVLRIEEGRRDEALRHFRQALLGDEVNYLARYHYAMLLREESAEDEGSVAGYAARTRAIREEIKKAIASQPSFLESYRLLAEVDLERAPALDETVALLERAISRAPGRPDLTLLLAQLHLRRAEFEPARRVLAELAQRGGLAPFFRTKIEALREKITESENIAARNRAGDEAAQTEAVLWPGAQPCDMPDPGPQWKRLRFNGAQVCGRLVSIECSGAGVTLEVESGARTLRFGSLALERIRFITYTSEVRGRLECGARPAAKPVLITFRPAKFPGALDDGEVVAVEFVPQDWSH